jgi:hypothetical protein
MSTDSTTQPSSLMGRRDVFRAKLDSYRSDPDPTIISRPALLAHSMNPAGSVSDILDASGSFARAWRR